VRALSMASTQWKRTSALSYLWMIASVIISRARPGTPASKNSTPTRYFSCGEASGWMK
jgi:hypothetical protein